MESLAVKYRPKTFSDLVEQDVVKKIIVNQINNNDIRNSYLFCGASGSGKTTSARIFSNDINSGGIPTELDAASHSGADDIRKLVEESKYKPIGYKYRIFIIDEAHSLSNQAWQVFLKAIEEPTPTSIFIFCTTDPQKIPKTILSRVQRYDFRRISNNGIINRLKFIIDSENSIENKYSYDDEALSYIAKLSDGGMRTAITNMEKVLGYSDHLTVDSVVNALGTVDYSKMFDLTEYVLNMDCKKVIEQIENMHMSGCDLKLFVKNYCDFMLDLCKYNICKSFDSLQIPNMYEETVKKYTKEDFSVFIQIMNEMLNLMSDIKWDSSPKARIEASFILLSSAS